MNCTRCRAEVPKAFKFCPECGNALSSRDSAVEEGKTLGVLRTVVGGVGAGEGLSLGEMRTVEVGVVKAEEVGIGEVIGGRCELLEELGRGGFAVVWKARDRKLGRVVAVKRLVGEKLRGAGSEQTLARFRREAQAIAQLNHRNIVAVYDHDRNEKGDYIVMEYVAGGTTLREYLKARGG